MIQNNNKQTHAIAPYIAIILMVLLQLILTPFVIVYIKLQELLMKLGLKPTPKADIKFNQPNNNTLTITITDAPNLDTIQIKNLDTDTETQTLDFTDNGNATIGDTITLDNLNEGDTILVTGIVDNSKKHLENYTIEP